MASYETFVKRKYTLLLKKNGHVWQKKRISNSALKTTEELLGLFFFEE